LNLWLVVSNMFFSISSMGCHPNPIDELHHFSRWAHCNTKPDYYTISYTSSSSSFPDSKSFLLEDHPTARFCGENNHGY
jgi:hypothetical protein